jgi:hypothetical protein
MAQSLRLILMSALTAVIWPPRRPGMVPSNSVFNTTESIRMIGPPLPKSAVNASANVQPFALM